MATKIIVSYDGTANEDDAIALGGLFARAGAEVALAYVRHNQEPDREREALAEAEAHELLARGAELLGDPGVATYVVTDRSTPEGLAALAATEGADVIVFCSDSHTAKGHVGDRQLGAAPDRRRHDRRRDRARGLRRARPPRPARTRRGRQRRRRRRPRDRRVAGARRWAPRSRRSPTTTPACW